MFMSYWTKDELRILRRLREGFIQGTAGDADYWKGEAELELYDATSCQTDRLEIGTQSSESCNSGAGKRMRIGLWILGVVQEWPLAGVLEQWPERFRSVTLMDRSALARSFAAKQVRDLPGRYEVEAVPAGEIGLFGSA